MQQAMKVVSSKARSAAVSIGQTTGLCVLAMLETNPFRFSLLLSSLDGSGETQRTQQKNSVNCASVNSSMLYRLLLLCACVPEHIIAQETGRLS